LTEVGRYSYYAEDPATGRVEYEYDHVLLGDLPVGQSPRPDPDEVAALQWVTVPSLLAALGADPRAYAPWLVGVTDRLAEHLAEHVAASAAPGPRRPSNAGPLRTAAASPTEAPTADSERSGGR
jgi:isopentenyl-diphosphate delta-isomerase